MIDTRLTGIAAPDMNRINGAGMASLDVL